MAVHLAVAGDVYDGVFLWSFFPRDVLDEILDLKGFSTVFQHALKLLDLTDIVRKIFKGLKSYKEFKF